MTFDVPRSVLHFGAHFLGGCAFAAPRHIRHALASVIAGIVLTISVRRSMTAIGSEVFSASRNKSTVSRMFRDKRFKSREFLHKASARAIRQLAPKDKETVRWLLAIDGTAVQHGADTLIKGAVSPERKEKGKRRKRNAPRQRTAGSSKKKGRRTKYHTFLIGIVTTHTGVRIPVGRYTCDPKDFKRPGGQKKMRDTQLDLAKLMIERVLSILPKGIHLMVVADSYFEGEKLYGLADRRGFTLITPTDSNRCFADETSPNKSNGSHIRDYGLQLPASVFSRLDLRRGSEETACYRRYSARKAGPKDRRTYWLHHERRTVAKLGTVGIVYSWKTPVYGPRRNFRKKGFKILFCSDPALSGQEIVEWYECRWTAIEIVIRELKGQLGLDHYTGQDLEGLERHIDLVLLSFLYLEMRRHELLTDETTPPAIQARAEVLRTQGMQDLVRWEANQQLLAAIRKSHRSERTWRRLNRFFKEVPSLVDVLPARRAA